MIHIRPWLHVVVFFLGDDAGGDGVAAHNPCADEGGDCGAARDASARTDSSSTRFYSGATRVVSGGTRIDSSADRVDYTATKDDSVATADFFRPTLREALSVFFCAQSEGSTGFRAHTIETTIPNWAAKIVLPGP